MKFEILSKKPESNRVNKVMVNNKVKAIEMVEDLTRKGYECEMHRVPGKEDINNE